jgi:hypothetical protein
VPLLIFGAALWAFMLFGLTLHAADIQHRHRRGLMALKKYQSPRIIEWLLSSLILFAAAAAALGLLEILGLWHNQGEGTVRFQAFIGAAVAAVGLAYVAVRGASWVHWAKDRFVQSPGAVTTEHGQVMVQIGLEAIYDARLMRKVVWPAYTTAAAIMLVAAAVCGRDRPFILPLGFLLAVMGAALVWIVVNGLPESEEEKRW